MRGQENGLAKFQSDWKRCTVSATWQENLQQVWLIGSQLWFWFFFSTLLIRKSITSKRKVQRDRKTHSVLHPDSLICNIRGQEQNWWWSTSTKSWPNVFCLLTAVVQVMCLLPARSSVLSFSSGNLFLWCYWGFPWPLPVVQPTVSTLSLLVRFIFPCKRIRDLCAVPLTHMNEL